MRKFSIRITAVFLMSLVFFGMYKEDPKKSSGLAKIETNDLKGYIDINQIYMLFYNNGIGAFDAAGSGTSGLFWPKGSAKTAIYCDGLVWAGYVGTNDLRSGGSTYKTGLQAGPINADGTASDPTNPRYKIWSLKRDETTTDDYKNWPVDLGAPYTTDEYGVKVPAISGDQMYWFVMNDMDASRTAKLYGTAPMGIEVQCSIFGFNQSGPLGNMVFKKYKLINKGHYTIRDMILGQWIDPDLGDASDDYVGCDTLRSLGFVYNGTNMDGTGGGATYGAAPPAAGYDFFQGPIIPYDKVLYPIITEKNLPDSAKFDGKWRHGYTNLPLTSFSFYINSGPDMYKDPDLAVPAGTQQLYNYMTSKDYNGVPFVDPTQGNIPVNFCLYGDPVKKTGWYEGVPAWASAPAPGDRRMMLSSGKFTFAPGDTQEVVVAVMVARGSDNLNSVTDLKMADDIAQVAYNVNFDLVPAPPNPKMHYAELDKKLILYWEDNAETFRKFNPLLGNQGLKDTVWKFGGYQIYQYSDASYSNAKLLGTYDLPNDAVDTIKDYVTMSGQKVLLPSIEPTNFGLIHSFAITYDYIKNAPLVNGTPYYFGVRSYSYCMDDAPRVKWSPQTIVTPDEAPTRGLTPHAMPVGEQFTFKYNDLISANKLTSSTNDGIAAIKVIDPTVLTGHDYEIFMTGVDTSLRWNLRDVTANDTLITGATFDTLNIASYATNGFDFNGAKVFDGLAVRVANPVGTNRVKEVVLVKDAGIDVPVSKNEVVPMVPYSGQNVFGVATATNHDWWVASIATSGISSLQQLGNDGIIKEKDFEFRFGTDSSYFYSFSSRPTNGQIAANPVGKNKVPFTVWNVTNNSAQQAYIKVFDGHPAVTVNSVTTSVGKIDTAWTGTLINQARFQTDSLVWEDIYVWQDSAKPYADPVYGVSSRRTVKSEYPLVNFALCSHDGHALPAPGSVIRINTWKTIKPSDKFSFTATKPKMNDAVVGKSTLDRISVYPNPYFGAHAQEVDKYQRWVRFMNLPNKAIIRLYTVAGTFVRRIEKDDSYKTYTDWDLKNKDGIPVASGMFIAYIEIPGIGTKVLKLAVIQETPYIDRL